MASRTALTDVSEALTTAPSGLRATRKRSLTPGSFPHSGHPLWWSGATCLNAAGRCVRLDGQSCGTVRRCAPFRLALGAGLRQRTPHSRGIAIDVIDGRAGLLPPGVVEPSVVDWVEPEFVHQSHHDLVWHVGRRPLLAEQYAPEFPWGAHVPADACSS